MVAVPFVLQRMAKSSRRKCEPAYASRRCSCATTNPDIVNQSLTTRSVAAHSVNPSPLIAGNRSLFNASFRKCGFTGLNFRVGDPPRKIAVWRKRASQLLLISEHDVRV
jgi:hypothetical protein